MDVFSRIEEIDKFHGGKFREFTETPRNPDNLFTQKLISQNLISTKISLLKVFLNARKCFFFSLGYLLLFLKSSEQYSCIMIRDCRIAVTTNCYPKWIKFRNLVLCLKNQKIFFTSYEKLTRFQTAQDSFLTKASFFWETVINNFESWFLIFTIPDIL